MVVLDLQQAVLMWQLRIRIDKWSVGLNEEIRERNRHLLTDAYLRCPPRRVWLYMKFVKAFLMLESDKRILEEVTSNMMSEERLASEDIIVKGMMPNTPDFFVVMCFANY